MVVISGWVEEIRDKGKIKFILLNCGKEKAQVTLKKGVVKDDLLKIVEKLTRQSAVRVEGDLVEKPIAKIGKEIIPKEIEIVGLSKPILPLDPSGKTKADMETKIEWRPLALRSEKYQFIFRVEAEIVRLAQEFLNQKGFIQVFTPCLIGAASEGGAEVFKVKYFDKEVFLRQDPQLHRELTVIGGFTKIYEIGPCWRAELSHTPRHLTEHRVIAVEKGFIKDEYEIIELEKNLVLFIIKNLVRKFKEDFEKFGIKLKIPKKVPILEFPKIYEILEEMGKKIEFGEDYDRESEKLLGKYVQERFNSDIFFVNRFPFKTKPFYVMRYDDEPIWARSVDMLIKGIEISSGGQREHRYEKLIENIKEKGLNLKNLEWFVEHFKYGACPLGGFAIGIERLTMTLLDLTNIKDAVLFPRTPERALP